ncbi:TPA: RlmF-related methyltransferase, partial [Escherichia coli]|nr:RlmF-related methyltransferase [Escherichia coli]
MSPEKKSLHPRNKHRDRYDFPILMETDPGFKTYVFTNPYGDLSVDFSDPNAVKA